MQLSMETAPDGLPVSSDPPLKEAAIQQAKTVRVDESQISSQSAVLHRSLHDVPKKVVKASGIWLTLEDGQVILDATGGAAVTCLGHNDTRIQEAVNRQMQAFSYCHTFFFRTDIGEALANTLINSTQHKMSRVYIISSGSEAMEAAMKMSRQYFLELHPPQPQRCRFIARKQSYHGVTLGSLGMGGHVARRASFEPMLTHNVSHVSPCYAYRGMKDGETNDVYVARLAAELDEEFQRVGPDTVCAFVAEPVVGAALGCVPAVPGYFPAMKAVCDRYGALLVLDEVMCGIGRTGFMHAWMDEGVVPDLQTIGKGLGGGYVPVAGMLVGKKVVDVLSKGTGGFSHGQTYQGHPIACAAAEAVVGHMLAEDLMANVQAMGQLLEKGLDERLSHHRHVGDIRGKGLFWGIEFVKDKTTKEPFDPALGVATAIHNLGMQTPYSISLYPGNGSADGRRGDHVLVAPPYNSSREEIELIISKTGDVIEDYFRLQGTQRHDLVCSE